MLQASNNILNILLMRRCPRGAEILPTQLSKGEKEKNSVFLV
jgi:hypothetical protein